MKVIRSHFSLSFWSSSRFFDDLSYRSFRYSGKDLNLTLLTCFNVRTLRKLVLGPFISSPAITFPSIVSSLIYTGLSLSFTMATTTVSPGAFKVHGIIHNELPAGVNTKASSNFSSNFSGTRATVCASIRILLPVFTLFTRWCFNSESLNTNALILSPSITNWQRLKSISTPYRSRKSMPRSMSSCMSAVKIESKYSVLPTWILISSYFLAVIFCFPMPCRFEDVYGFFDKNSVSRPFFTTDTCAAVSMTAFKHLLPMTTGTTKFFDFILVA